jgi:hypothetical protein
VQSKNWRYDMICDCYDYHTIAGSDAFDKIWESKNKHTWTLWPARQDQNLVSMVISWTEKFCSKRRRYRKVFPIVLVV